MIGIKPGVRVSGVQPEIVLAIVIAESIWPEELVVTRIGESVAGQADGSLHLVGFGVDFRLPAWDVTRKVGQLAGCLGAEFDVVLEKDHVHVEYQPKV